MNNKKPSPNQTTDQQRRYFIRDLLAEVITVCEEISGRPQLKIRDLDQLPDEVLREMVPVIQPNQPIKVKGHQLSLYNRDTNTYEGVGRLRPEQKQFLMALDGRCTLAQLAREVARVCRMDPTEAYSVVKPFFCLLACIGVCAPLDAHMETSASPPDQKRTLS